MSTTLEKEYAAIDGDEIVMTKDSVERLKESLEREGIDEDDVEIVALPKSQTSLFV